MSLRASQVATADVLFGYNSIYEKIKGVVVLLIRRGNYLNENGLLTANDGYIHRYLSQSYRHE